MRSSRILNSDSYRRSSSNRMPPIGSNQTRSNVNRLTLVDEIRLDLESASNFRQRLLTNIEETMVDIDRELTTLQMNSSRLNQPLPKLKSKSEVWPKKTKRTYQVVPRIQPVPRFQFGRYHYAIEVAELELEPNDFENIETTVEITNSYQDMIKTTESFVRPCSIHVEFHRAHCFVPQLVEHQQFSSFLETIDSIQSESVKIIDIPDDGDGFRLNIVDFQSLIQTAAELSNDIDDTDVSTVIDGIPVKPLKHHFVSTKSVASPLKREETRIETHFFSDFGENDEDLIVIDPPNFFLPDNNDENKSS